MEPDRYSGTGGMTAFALSNRDRVIARVERSCTINGRAFAVEPGDGADRRAYVDLSIGWLRYINHMHPGLLFQVASTEDEASRYTPVLLTLNPATIPTIDAD